MSSTSATWSARAVVALVALAACATPYVTGARDGGAGGEVPIRDRFARGRLDLLAAVNADRREAGVEEVTLDSLATVVAQAHAEALAIDGHLSHYGADGSAPYERYAEAGGTGHVLENVFRWRSGAGAGPPGPWEVFDVRSAQASLMRSPGHRATILDPHRTAVGLGIAVHERSGSVLVVQEFVARHVDLEVPLRGWRRATTTVRGRMLDDGLRPLLVVLTREPSVGPWATAGEPPPGGSYPDGATDGTVVGPWSIRWNPDDRTFEVALSPAAPVGSGRTYGVVYVAPVEVVRRALSARRVETRAGWPGGAFVLDVL